jgi:hypothetical protein
VKLSPRDRRIAMFGALAAAVILAYYFGLDPAIAKWTDASKRITERERVIEDARSGNSVRARAAALRERMDFEVTKYVTVEDFDAHMPAMITQLTDFDTYPGVTRLDTMPTQVTGTHAKCSLSLSFECGLDQLVEFLYDLQRARPLLVVNDLRVTATDKDSSLLRIRMTVCSFAMLEEEGTG